MILRAFCFGDFEVAVLVDGYSTVDYGIRIANQRLYARELALEAGKSELAGPSSSCLDVVPVPSTWTKGMSRFHCFTWSIIVKPVKMPFLRELI